MKYKFVIMKELNDSGSIATATPYLIVDSEERAEEKCFELESHDPNFLYWYMICEEET